MISQSLCVPTWVTGRSSHPESPVKIFKDQNEKEKKKKTPEVSSEEIVEREGGSLLSIPDFYSQKF